MLATGWSPDGDRAEGEEAARGGRPERNQGAPEFLLIHIMILPIMSNACISFPEVHFLKCSSKSDCS